MSDVPTHIAIIPDGNRRWAKERGLTSAEGHQAGADATRTVSLHAADAGIQHLSLWGMSLDNFRKRSPVEIQAIFRIFRDEFAQLAESDDIHNRQVNISVFGRWQEKFPAAVRRPIEHAIQRTASYSERYLHFFLAYNGIDEMVQTVQHIVDDSGDQPQKVTPELIKENLFTKDLPPVDLLIRTGGEPHLSAGFMMWDIADAQLYFTETYWPAFGPDQLNEALADYASRGRRFGK